MLNDQESELHHGFHHYIDRNMAALKPAERRVAQFFVGNREAVLLGSAAQIADLAGSSDATVVRTAKALGFESLSALREYLLADMTGAPPPGHRLANTLDEAGDAANALTHVIDIHQRVLDVLARPHVTEAFGRVVEILNAAPHRHIFGIGPSGALADYASLQFNRIGLPTSALTASGVGLADQLLRLRDGEAVLLFAYAPLYREVEVVLESAAQHDCPVVLVSDSLGPLVNDQVAVTLPVPRGKAGHLAMHGGTMVLIEALIIGLAAQVRERSLDTLDRLSTMRGAVDRAWIKRGTRKK